MIIDEKAIPFALILILIIAVFQSAYERACLNGAKTYEECKACMGDKP